MDIELVGKIKVISFTGNKEGNVEVINTEEEYHSIKMLGLKKDKYLFAIRDENNNEYEFEYYYDEEEKTVVLNIK